jgi:hypothetical protein
MYSVSDVWVHGRRLLRHRELTTMDESIVKEKVSTWHDAIRDFHQELEKKN